MMKQLRLSLTLTLLISALMISCSKDNENGEDESKAGSSSLKIDGEELTWNNYGELWHYPNEDNRYDVFNFSKSLKLSSSYKLEGSGDMLEIEFYPNSSSLDNVTYQINDSEDPGSCTLSLDRGISIVNGYPQTTSNIWFKSGTIKVSGSNKKYTITINAVGENGEKLVGQYTSSYGTMTVN